MFNITRHHRDHPRYTEYTEAYPNRQGERQGWIRANTDKRLTQYLAWCAEHGHRPSQHGKKGREERTLYQFFATQKYRNSIRPNVRHDVSNDTPPAWTLQGSSTF
jgi:hypothetical protein